MVSLISTTVGDGDAGNEALAIGCGGAEVSVSDSATGGNTGGVGPSDGVRENAIVEMAAVSVGHPLGRSGGAVMNFVGRDDSDQIVGEVGIGISVIVEITFSFSRGEVIAVRSAGDERRAGFEEITVGVIGIGHGASGEICDGLNAVISIVGKGRLASHVIDDGSEFVVRPSVGEGVVVSRGDCLDSSF